MSGNPRPLKLPFSQVSHIFHSPKVSTEVLPLPLMVLFSCPLGASFVTTVDSLPGLFPFLELMRKASLYTSICGSLLGSRTGTCPGILVSSLEEFRSKILGVGLEDSWMLPPRFTLKITFPFWPQTRSYHFGFQQVTSAYSGHSSQRQVLILVSIHCLRVLIQAWKGLNIHLSISLSSISIFFTYSFSHGKNIPSHPSSHGRHLDRPLRPAVTRTYRCLQMFYPSWSKTAWEESESIQFPVSVMFLHSNKL